jgi:hypothetical protein
VLLHLLTAAHGTLLPKANGAALPQLAKADSSVLYIGVELGAARQ